MWHRFRRGSWSVAAVVLIGLAAGGCSGSDDGPTAEGPTPSVTPSAAPEVSTQISLGQVAGTLP